jgi:alpha-beta hydrolase superfamily lysophospholipase
MPDWPAVRRNLRVALVTFALTLGIVYLGVCYLFWAYEPAFVFAQLPRAAVAPEAAGLDGFAEIAVTADDGARLFGWWRPPEPGHGAIVFLTGTGVSLQDCAPLLGDLAAHGFGVLGIDYRGNGASPGTPSEAAWRADARAAFDFVETAAPAAKIAAFGESMGTGFAVGLALQRPVAGVLLNSPYASVARLFELHGIALLPHVPLPARLLMRDPLDSEALIGQLAVPVMILHGTADAAIPISEARRLYAAAREPKTMIEVADAQHVQTWFGESRDRALAALAAWTAPAAAPSIAGRTSP